MNQPKGRWILETLGAYAVVVLYGCVQRGVTGGPMTPELALDSIEAAGMFLAGAQWLRNARNLW